MAKLTSRPIVIIGAARSGTRILREVISTSKQVCAIPYDVNFVWRYGNEEKTHDVIYKDEYDQKTARVIRSKLINLAYAKHSNRSDYFVEKTVSNALRLPYVCKVLPNAKIVYIERSKYDVIESALRQWRGSKDIKYLMKKAAYVGIENKQYMLKYIYEILKNRMTNRQAIWGPKYPGIRNDIQDKGAIRLSTKQWAYCVRRSKKAMEEIPSDKYIQIRYNDFVNSIDTCKRVLQFLSIKSTEHIKKWYLNNVSSKFIGRGKNELSNKEKEIIDSTLNNIKL